MKKQYRDPELELVLFSDVIITSGGGDSDPYSEQEPIMGENTLGQLAY